MGRKKKEPPVTVVQAPADPDCYTIAEFCKSHRLSRTLYYKLQHAGLGPVETRLIAGGKVLITKEAAARWRAEREAASNAA